MNLRKAKRNERKTPGRAGSSAVLGGAFITSKLLGQCHDLLNCRIVLRHTADRVVMMDGAKGRRVCSEQLQAVQTPLRNLKRVAMSGRKPHDEHEPGELLEPNLWFWVEVAQVVPHLQNDAYVAVRLAYLDQLASHLNVLIVEHVTQSGLVVGKLLKCV